MQARLLAASLLLLGSYPLYAADDTATPIIVTATRTAQTVDETLAAVTVITRKDIERQQATTIEDVLRGNPGLSLRNNGGLGKTTSVFMRGTESSHVLVLIDGVKVGSATSGTTAFEDIPIDQIERIEIVRGPRSSLYGSEAIGGVIQIFTRKGGGTTMPSFSLGAGSHDTYTGSAGVSGGGKRGWYNLNISGLSSDGFDACRGAPYVSPSSPGGGCNTYESDDDSSRNRSGALRGGFRLDNGTEVDAYILSTKARVHYDGTSSNESDSGQQVAGGRVGLSPMVPWRMALAAGRSHDDSDNFLNGVFNSRFNTARDTASFQNDFTLSARHLLTLGLDYQNDRIASTTAFTVTERRNTGVFSQYQGTYGAQDIQFSVRGDDNEQFGNYTTGGLAWGYGLSRDLRFIASYGTAFKAPTFNDLYWPSSSSTDFGTTYIYQGNPVLLPETSKSWEVGLRNSFTGGTTMSLSVYETEVRDLINLITVFTAPSTLTTTTENLERARIRGLEATVKTQISGWILGTNLTLLDPQNRSGGANDGNVLRRRAEETFRLDLDRSSGKFRYGSTLFAEGRRFEDAQNKVELKSYATVDLRLDYALAKNWTLGGRISNLFDRSYETAAFYNQDGRNYFITLRYHATARDGESTRNASAISSTDKLKQPT